MPSSYPPDFVHSETRRLRHQPYAELILHPSTAGPELEDDKKVSRLIVLATYFLF